LHLPTSGLIIQTIMERKPDEIGWIVAVLSHVTHHLHRWSLVQLAAEQGGFTFSQAKKELGLTNGGLNPHLDRLVGANILATHEGSYRLTDWGRLAFALVTRWNSNAVSDLAGSQLVLVDRPRAVDPRDVLGLLAAHGATVLRTAGKYRYVAISDEDPDLVDDLMFALEERGARPLQLAVTKVTP